MALVAVAMVAHNAVYLWTRKRAQFLERAAPTEQLIALAHRVSGPIFVRCYPDPTIIADAAIRMRAPGATLIWDPKRAAEAKAEFCYQRR